MKPVLNPKLGPRNLQKRLVTLLAALLVFLAIRLGFTGPRYEPPPAQQASVQAAFESDCEGMLVAEINRAETEILVAIYSMTRRSVTSAFADAVKRGVNVRLKYDQEQYDFEGMKTSIGFLKKRGIECKAIRMENDRSRMHHKFVVIDGKRVLTGSFNFTTTASENNYENLVTIESPDIARQFIDEFERIKSRKAE